MRSNANTAKTFIGKSQYKRLITCKQMPKSEGHDIHFNRLFTLPAVT